MQAAPPKRGLEGQEEYSPDFKERFESTVRELESKLPEEKPTQSQGQDKKRHYEVSNKEMSSGVETSDLSEGKDNGKPEFDLTERHWAAGGGKKPSSADEQAAAESQDRESQQEYAVANAPDADKVGKVGQPAPVQGSHWDKREWDESIGEGVGNYPIVEQDTGIAVPTGGGSPSQQEKKSKEITQQVEAGAESLRVQEAATYKRTADIVSARSDDEKYEAKAEAYCKKEEQEAAAEASRKIAEAEARKDTELARADARAAAEEERAKKILAAAQAEKEQHKAEAIHRAEKLKADAEHEMRARVAKAHERASHVRAGEEERGTVLGKVAESLGFSRQ